MSLPWTKAWEVTDDGTTLRAVDLKNIQTDVDAGFNTTDATITNLSSVYAPIDVLSDLVFYDDEIVSYENDLVHDN